MRFRTPMTWLRGKAEPRLFTVMHTLLYPGVLGSLMYALPDNIAAGRVSYDAEQIVLACALFSMFVMDYTHSVLKRNEAAYSHGTFIADLLIVGLLFLAGQRILGTAIPPDVHPAWLLAAMKLAAVSWEWVKHQPAPTAEDRESDANAIGTDFAFALAYAVAAVASQLPPHLQSVATLLFILALLGDAFFYVAYPWLKRPTGKRDGGTSAGRSKP